MLNTDLITLKNKVDHLMLQANLNLDEEEQVKQACRALRIPDWLQDEEIPICCNVPMTFCSQILEDTLSSNRPKNAKCWWHDCVGFYIFTCSICLQVKAIGQQL